MAGAEISFAETWVTDAERMAQELGVTVQLDARLRLEEKKKATLQRLRGRCKWVNRWRRMFKAKHRPTSDITTCWKKDMATSGVGKTSMDKEKEGRRGLDQTGCE